MAIYEERTLMIPASSLVVMWTRDMVAMVTFVFPITASSSHGGNPFCSDIACSLWFWRFSTDTERVPPP